MLITCCHLFWRCTNLKSATCSAFVVLKYALVKSCKSYFHTMDCNFLWRTILIFIWLRDTSRKNVNPTSNHTVVWSAYKFYTLDSGINVAPGITVAPPLKNFHIMILILFYINLGIAIIFDFFLSSKFFKN